MKKNFFNYRDGSLVFLFAVLGFLIISIIMSQLLGIISNASNIEFTQLSQSNWVVWLNCLLTELVYFLVVLIYCKTKKIEYFVASKTKTKFNVKVFLITILIGLVVFFASINFTGLFNYLFSFIAPLSNGNIPVGNFGEFTLTIITYALLPAICEEILFRGVIFNALRHKMNVIWSIILSALIFALIHFSIFQTIHQFVMGIVLAILCYYTGSIFYGMIYHFVNNFIIILISYITSNSGLEFSSWGSVEIMLSITIFLIGIGVTILLLYLVKRFSNKKKEDYDNEKQIIFEQNRFDYNGLSDKEVDVILKKDNRESSFILFSTIIFCILIWFMNSFGG